MRTDNSPAQPLTWIEKLTRAEKTNTKPGKQDQKEQIALDTVEGEMTKRLAVLANEVHTYSTTAPELQELIDQTAAAVKLAQARPHLRARL